MPPPIRPWTRRIIELVDAGLTDRAEIVRLAMPFVPQGHAYRVREQTNERLRRRVNGQPRVFRSERTLSEIHRVGANAVIHQTLHRLARSGTIVIDGNQIRRPS